MVKIAILARDINNIPVLEVVSEESRKELLPIVIFYHGWKSNKELVLTQARKLAQHNLRVVLPDAQNHGKRKQPISSVPSFTFWNSIQANLAEFGVIINFYQKIKLLDDQHIGVGGYSMGGITTSMLLTQHPEITAAACIMGSPAPSIYAQRVRDSATKYGLYVPTDLEQMTSWIDNYDLNLHPETINQRPLLLWHGTADERIPFSEPNDFYNQIKQESYAQNVDFLVGKDEGHLVNIELMDTVAEFFAQNI